MQARDAENEALQQSLNLADFKYELLVDLVSSWGVCVPQSSLVLAIVMAQPQLLWRWAHSLSGPCVYPSLRGAVKLLDCLLYVAAPVTHTCVCSNPTL